MSKFGNELIESAREAVSIAGGQLKPARQYDAELVDVGAIRKGLGLSQTGFAAKFGLAVATVRDWEKGRRKPDRTARTLLKVIARKPEAVIGALEYTHPRHRP